MHDLQIVKHPHIVSSLDQAEAEIILFGLHEVRHIEPADRVEYGAPEADATADEHIRQGGAFPGPVRQVYHKPRGSERWILLEVSDHVLERAIERI